MGVMQASQTIQAWPEESKEAAQRVIKQYGEPDKMTETRLTGHKPGPWKRIVASKTFYLHNFRRRIPIPLIRLSISGAVQRFTPLAEFDGSVVAERTQGKSPLRCHDEQASFLAQSHARHRDGGKRRAGGA
jgi:hypothetical protein